MITFFVLTNGRLPSRNNLKDLANLNTNDSVLANHLIQNTTQQNASDRLTAAQVKLHPIFWDAEKTLGFFVDVSNRLEKRDYIANSLKSQLEKHSAQTCRNDFMQILEPIIRDNLTATRRQTYYGNSVEQLLRALRNKVKII